MGFIGWDKFTDMLVELNDMYLMNMTKLIYGIDEFGFMTGFISFPQFSLTSHGIDDLVPGGSPSPQLRL